MKNRKQPGPGKNRTRKPCEELSRLSKKYSRRPEEADDLVQDLLLEAVRTRQDFTADGFMAWAHGFLRNRAAFVARTEGRRRKREKEAQVRRGDVNLTRARFPESFVETLPSSLRITARLINCGLNNFTEIYSASSWNVSPEDGVPTFVTRTDIRSHSFNRKNCREGSKRTVPQRQNKKNRIMKKI